MFFDYYIENKIQLLEWLTPCPDLNPIQNVLGILSKNDKVIFLINTVFEIRYWGILVFKYVPPCRTPAGVHVGTYYM